MHREGESVLGGRGAPRYRPGDEGCGSGVISQDLSVTKPDSTHTQAGPEPVLGTQELIRQ